MTRAAYEIAREYLGTPFRHRGRTETGLDCLGLLVIVAQRQGLTVFDKKVYGREPWKDGLREGLVENCGPPIDEDLAPDQILLMQLHADEGPAHVALVAPHEYGIGMIHTWAAAGKVVEHRMDDRLKKMIVEVFRWPAKV